MKKLSKFISVSITLLIAAVFVTCASFFAVNFNKWFDGDLSSEAKVSISDLLNGKIIVDLEMTGVDVTDAEFDDENNIYGFPISEMPYFIYVEKGAHTLSIFSKDSYGFYTVPVATWSTATGKSASMTPTGTFSLGKREEWHTWPAGTYSPYTTTYYEANNDYGGLFIHGPIYRDKNFSTVFGMSVARIGTNCSSGCLRTEVEAAYFVYNMCDSGTLIEIVEGAPLGFRPYRRVVSQNQKIQPNLEHFLISTVAPSKISFKEETHKMTIGEKYTPEIIVTPSYAGNVNGTWTTNNPAAVKILGNVIQAVGTGSAIVTFTTAKGGVSSSILINSVVGNVDTSAAPPNVGGGTITDNGNITPDYKPISESLVYLIIKDTTYRINEDVQPLLKALGKKYYTTKAQSCAYDGEDKVFTYSYKNNGVCEISTVPLVAGEDRICEISVRNYFSASLKSSKGIKIGDSLSDIEREYGRFYTQEYVQATDKNDAFTRVVYWTGEPNKPGTAYLYFILDSDGDKVTGMGIFSGRNIG